MWTRRSRQTLKTRLMPGYWLLSGAREATPGAEALAYDTLSIPSTLPDFESRQSVGSSSWTAMIFRSLWRSASKVAGSVPS